MGVWLLFDQAKNIRLGHTELDTLQQEKFPQSDIEDPHFIDCVKHRLIALKLVVLRVLVLDGDLTFLICQIEKNYVVWINA